MLKSGGLEMIGQNGTYGARAEKGFGRPTTKSPDFDLEAVKPYWK
jgi:hypothetical protein